MRRFWMISAVISTLLHCVYVTQANEDYDFIIVDNDLEDAASEVNDQLKVLDERVKSLEHKNKETHNQLQRLERRLVEMELNVAKMRKQERLRTIKEEVDNPQSDLTTSTMSASNVYPCGDPPHLSHTRVNVVETKDGYVASYSCKAGYKNVGGKKTSSKCCTHTFKWRPLDILCSDLRDCYAVIGWKARYRGTVNVTKSGRPCQRWDSKSPQWHILNSNRHFKQTAGPFGRERLKDVANYCRDAGQVIASKYLWCFTQDPKKRAERCDVPKC